VDALSQPFRRLDELFVVEQEIEDDCIRNAKRETGALLV
jgi:hypothetical protein